VQVGGELVERGEMGGFRGGTEGDGHYFCFAEEYAGGGLLDWGPNMSRSIGDG
jgi:hypothetical protein